MDNSRVIYITKLREAKSRGLPTRSEIEEAALANNLLSLEERQEKKDIVDLIRRNEKAREISTDPRQKCQIDQEIEQLTRRIIEIEIGESEIFAHTAEAFASQIKHAYLTQACTLRGDLLDTPVWESWQACLGDSNNFSLLKQAQKAYARVSSGLPITIIRALARTQEWRLRWRSAIESHSQPFPGSSSDWDRNKLQLVQWSHFYDTVYQHPEAPDESVINDDDALQTWVNTQTNKRSKPQGPASSGRTLYQRNGSGKRQPMQKVGQEHRQVNQPYRIRK